jgi:flagellar biosynthetic protein FliR
LDLSLLTVNTVIAFLLVLFRISGMLVSAPLLNMPNIPGQAKVGIAFAIAFILFPLHSAALIIPKDLIQFAVLAFQETIIGILLGFTANLTFMALQMAGEYISMQMGLSVAHIIDPITQTQSPLVGQFFFYFAAMMFLDLNIHHALIAGIDRSFTWIPLGHFIGDGKLSAGLMTERFIHLGSGLFVMALTIGVPVMGIMLVMEVALGFVAKVMPQMNVFMVAMPLKIVMGLLVIMLSLPFFSSVLGDQYAHLVRLMLSLYKT